MNRIAEKILIHYGMPKRSGRYPWGSGNNPYQHSGDFLSRVEELHKQGFSEKQIADTIGLSTTELRVQKRLAKNERRDIEYATAVGLREKGYSLDAIATEMGYKNDSSVRALLNIDTKTKQDEVSKVADFIREQIDSKGMIDVGTGVERELGVTRTKFDQALYMLEREGYPMYGGGVPQLTNPNQQTNLKIICPPGTEHKEIYDFKNINSLKDYYSPDDGETYQTLQYPKSLDSNRLMIRYAEDGGINKDGVVEVRRGVEDVSLGESKYSQVRILVDDKKYIKGMAVYGDDFPKGVDLIFNTNKSKNVPKLDVLKDISDNPDNPFGSLIKAGGQRHYLDSDGNSQLSVINKRADEGDWDKWSNKLSSQFLSKQNTTLIKKQLDLDESTRRAEFEEILSLTNPTVKKVLLESFASDSDSAAVQLKAAALPRQRYQVILPLNSVKDNEVYAPNFKDGEKVALIRYPHGGTFEIPILTVNNKNKEGKSIITPNGKDAVGINSKVAERLSGADFDGDTVMVIPTGGKTKITSTPKLKALEGFDPKLEYPYREGMTLMKNTKKGTDNTQVEMGMISNLITDMTIKGANQDELARAVKHSMVVIDAGKHKLNYKQSYEDNAIASLKLKYQGTYDDNGKLHTGASTLISRASSQTSVTKRTGNPNIDPVTGRQSYSETFTPNQKVKDTPQTYINPKTGKTTIRTQSSTKMAETDDARTLSSGTPKEELYAAYANNMKALANDARREMLNAGKIEYSSEAKKTYQAEYDSLNAKLNVALLNKPRERQAQVIANATVSIKKQEYPDMTNSELKKQKQIALDSARRQVGATKESITITDKEWEAIQSGAISENRLKQILDNTKIDDVRALATPRTTNTLTTAKETKAKAMIDSGYTTAQVAEALGVSTSTIRKGLTN